MLLIGLTGNIASGKSTVARLLSERGATIIDADVLARRAVEVGTAAYDEIVRRWGSSVVAPDQTLDRGALRRIVFSDQSQLEELNSIVHPEVTALRSRLVADAEQRGDRIVVVDAPRPIRLERLVRQRGLDETEAMDMITAQMPADLKRARADYVIENTSTLRALEERVSEVWDALEREALVREGASTVS